MRRFTQFSMGCAVFGAAIGTAEPCSAAARANAATGRWFWKVADKGSDSVWAGTLRWASAARINWSADLTADNIYNGGAVAGESKFTVPAVGFPTAKAWANFLPSWDPPGPGSKAHGQGTGSSNVGAVFYGANWEVLAGGLKGAQAGAMYESKVVGKDPWNMYPEDVETAEGDRHSVYIPFSIMGGSAAPNTAELVSSYNFDVTYETTSGMTTLLEIDVVGNDVTVNGNSPESSSNLKFYIRGGEYENPMENALGSPTTLVNIRDLLAADAASDHSIDSPLHLGVLLDDILIPTEMFSDGAIARVGVENGAYELATPEPSSLALLSLCGLVALRRRRPEAC